MLRKLSIIAPRSTERERAVIAKDALAGKVAIVTGAGTGIGTGIVEALVGAGAKVTISYHSNRTGADKLAEGLRQKRGDVRVQACDLREYGQVQALFDTTLKEFGRVDILVNNSGITEPHSILEMTADEWDKTLNVNLRGMFFCTQRAAKEMIRQGSGGRIVNLSSVHSFAAVPNHAHYEASKGGINMFTKASAIELAPHNIQVNAIAPGAIEVERYFGFPGYQRDEWGTRIPAGRVGFPNDIGPLAAFLCSEGASYITGQIIWVDGGMTARLGAIRS
jgi:glucose 1-dehydrogenase/3-oxoacyl-[acyl-carrier protein] reductase